MNTHSVKPVGSKFSKGVKYEVPAYMLGVQLVVVWVTLIGACIWFLLDSATGPAPVGECIALLALLVLGIPGFILLSKRFGEQSITVYPDHLLIKYGSKDVRTYSTDQIDAVLYNDAMVPKRYDRAGVHVYFTDGKRHVFSSQTHNFHALIEHLRDVVPNGVIVEYDPKYAVRPRY